MVIECAYQLVASAHASAKVQFTAQYTKAHFLSKFMFMGQTVTPNGSYFRIREQGQEDALLQTVCNTPHNTMIHMIMCRNELRQVACLKFGHSRLNA
jgi:ribosomal protein S14